MQRFFTLSWQVFVLFTLLWYITLSGNFYGVYWYKRTKKYLAILVHQENGKRIIDKQVGYFNTELEAAKALNEMCDKYGMEHKNWELNGIPQSKIKNYYIGVYYTQDGKLNPWQAKLTFRQKTIHGGVFSNPKSAAKKINKMCKKYGLKKKNPELSSSDEEEDVHNKRNRPNHYIGIYYIKDGLDNPWRACLRIDNKCIHGGVFSNPKSAAKHVNKMCKTYGLKKKNPELSSDDEEDVMDRQNRTSKLYGTGWRNHNKRPTFLHTDGEKKYFGRFDTEKIATMHKQFGRPKKNKDLSSSEQEEGDIFQNKRKRTKFEPCDKPFIEQFTLNDNQQELIQIDLY